MITLEEKTAEVSRNFQAFKEKRATIEPTFFGKFALLRNKEIIDYFDSASDAIKFAEIKYKDGLYSIQKVTNKVVDLEYFSHAGSN